LLSIADRNPLNTTTFGTGELIAAAIREGAKKIVLGLGGSATVDAGIGMAQACGFTVLTRDGEPTSPSEPLCGRDLSNILMVKHGRGEITSGIEIIGLADVTNPLFGPIGAAPIFGPQKGASPGIVDQLDAELRNLSLRLEKLAEAAHTGAGAAGGLGFGILAFFHGSLVGGFDFIANAVNLRDRLKDADLCITAEGRLDSQTACGKAVVGVARMCRAQHIPCIALAGSIGEGAESLAAEGLTAHFTLASGPMPLEQSMRDAAQLLTSSARNCAKLWAARHG
jgi:glycerate kinase